MHSLFKDKELQKILLIMKNSLLIFLITAIHASASVFSHGQSLSLTAENKTVREVFRQIESESSYRFFYNEEFSDLSKAVSFEVIDYQINDVMDIMLSSSNVTYRILENDLVVITPVKKNSQEIIITGTVTDATTGEPLPGASVVVQGTTIGTVTGVDGKFNLSVPSRGDVLTFSFVGYITSQALIGDNNVININLREDILLLDEIVVVGYGTMQKQHLTGAVGSIRMDGELEYRPTSDIGSTMYGQVAGVQVLNTSGRPGVSSSIQVRGINSISAGASPLIVIDGIVLPDYDLSSINAADIESIHILKDAASASIYGSRAGNGVILITTKSGQAGRPSFSINHSSSIQQAIRRIDVMNSAEYAQAHIDAAQNAWIDIGGDPNAPNTLEARGILRYTWPEVFNNPESLFNTDWHDIVFRTAPMHKTDIRLTGGDENTTYLLSAGILNQQGILINTDYQKYSLNLRADSRITDWLSVGGLVNANIDYENRAGNTSVHTLTSASQFPPIYPVYGYDGYLGGPHNTEGLEDYENILFRTHHGHPYHRGGGGELLDLERTHIMGNLYGDVTILPGLNFRSSFNAFVRRNESKYYMNMDTGRGPDILRQARTEVSFGKTLNYTALNYLSYSNNWNAHQFDVMTGYEFTKREYYGISAQRRDYDNDLLPYLTAGATVHSANDNANASALISGFVRLNYNYESKYMASASFRRDGSSRFGPANKWGNFPSLSVGWRISEENFMQNADVLSNLNIRASYGFTGNENIGNYSWISSMSQSRVAFGDNLDLSYYPSSVQNPDLRWERTKQQNIGLDVGLFRDRIFLETDFYNSVSDDLLLNVPIPSTSGFNSMLRNIGEMRNRGVELKVTSYNLTGEFSWRTLLTYSANRNEVTRLGPDDAPMVFGPAASMEMINMVGHPIFSFYGLQYDGVYMNQAEIDADPAAYATAKPGDGRYKDINGDGVINADDRVIIGSNQPDFVWAMSNSFRYRNFDLSFQFQGIVGMDVMDLNFRRSFQYHEGRNYNRKLLNRWRSEEEPGDGHTYKLSVDLTQFDLTPSSYFIQNGSYLRLQNITVGYNLPDVFGSRLGFTSARIYFSGDNLLMITDFTGYDPENYSYSATDVARRGISHSQYPTAKTFVFGINVDF